MKEKHVRAAIVFVALVLLAALLYRKSSTTSTDVRLFFEGTQIDALVKKG